MSCCIQCVFFIYTDSAFCKAKGNILLLEKMLYEEDNWTIYRDLKFKVFILCIVVFVTVEQKVTIGYERKGRTEVS